MENSCHCTHNQHSDSVAGSEILKCGQFCTKCIHADFQLKKSLNISSQLWLNHEFLSSWGNKVSNFSELLQIIEIGRCEVPVGFSHLLHKTDCQLSEVCQITHLKITSHQFSTCIHVYYKKGGQIALTSKSDSKIVKKNLFIEK